MKTNDNWGWLTHTSTLAAAHSYTGGPVWGSVSCSRTLWIGDASLHNTLTVRGITVRYFLKIKATDITHVDRSGIRLCHWLIHDIIKPAACLFHGVSVWVHDWVSHLAAWLKSPGLCVLKRRRVRRCINMNDVRSPLVSMFSKASHNILLGKLTGQN